MKQINTKVLLAGIVTILSYTTGMAEKMPFFAATTTDPTSIACMKQAKALVPAHPAESSDNLLQFKISLKTQPALYENFNGLMAVPSDATDFDTYYRGGMDPFNMDAGIQLKVPAGTYDILCSVMRAETRELILLYKENFVVNDATPGTITFDTADAVKRHSTIFTYPDGNEIEFVPMLTNPDRYPIMQFIRVDYGTNNAGGVGLAESSPKSICYNLVPKAFDIRRQAIIYTGEGMMVYDLPLDLTKEVTRSDAGRWDWGEVKFAATPHNTPMDLWLSQHNAVNYRCNILNFLEENSNWKESITMYSVIQPNPTDKLWFYTPDKGARNNLASFFTGSMFNCPAGAIWSLPVRPGEEGLRLLGHNMAGSMELKYPLMAMPKGDGVSSVYPFNDGNPRFSGYLTDEVVELGNCAPVLVAIGDNMPFVFDFMGRHGEEMSIDAYNMADENNSLSVSPVNPAEAGGQTNSVKIWRGDRLICDDRASFPYNIDWTVNGEYKAEIMTENVMVDNEIPGFNRTVMEFSVADETTVVPTVSSLQFRDSHDKVTDRFATQSDGVIELTVAEFRFDQGTYVTDEISSVEVSYAPYGTESWALIPTQEVPELFFMPGYGYFHRGSLKNVNRGSSNKWYDVKIMVTDKHGASQQQVISPAFRIENPGEVGINSVVTPDEDNIDVWSIDGCLIRRQCQRNALKTLPHGIYVLKGSNGSTKLIL